MNNFTTFTNFSTLNEAVKRINTTILTVKDINAYFPIKKDKEGNLKEIELHFPISDEEEEKFGEFLEQLLEVFNSKKKNSRSFNLFVGIWNVLWNNFN